MTRVAYGYLIAGLIDVLIAAAILCYPFVAKLLDLGAFGTVTNTLFTFCYIVICLAVSRKRFFKDRRTYLAVGCILIALGGAILLVTKSQASMLISAFLYGTGAALFYPALQPWITEGMDNRRIVRVMGGYSIAWVVGYLLGPFIAGFVLSTAKLSKPALGHALDLIFGVTAVLGLLTAAFSLLNIYSHPRPEKKQPAGLKQEAHRTDVPQSRIRLFIKLLWINNFSAFFLTGLIRFIFTELGKAEHIDPLVVGSVTTVLYLTIIPVTVLLRVWHGWIFSFRWLAGFQLLSVPAVLFLAFTASVPLYFVSAVLFGVLSAFSFFASASYSLMLAGKKDAFININEAIIGVGGFLSALAGVLLAEFVSIKSSFLPGLGIAAVCLAVQAAVYLGHRRTA